MDWSMLLAAAVVALVALYLIQRKDFVMRVRAGRLECWGRLALVEQKALAQFLLHDLGVTEEVQVSGKWTGGRLRLWFRGPLTPGQQQRIRNFLVSGH
jgi:hypothetical protein